MSELGPQGTPTGDAARQHEREGDFLALAASTRRDLPGLATIVGSARRQRAGRPWEERWMSAIRTTKSRPWNTTVLAGGLAALALLFIPVSYERVTGHDVRITLAGDGIAMEQVTAIAQQLKQALGAASVNVQATASESGSQFVFGATVPVRRDVDVAAVASAFGASLNAKGYRAEASTDAIKERVSGNVYAYAMNQVIAIDLDGKSAPQIEAEIKQRFAEAGIGDAQVSVTQEDGAGGTKLGVQIKSVKQRTPGQTDAGDEKALPQLVLRKGGAPIADGKGFEVRISKTQQGDGLTLVVDVTQAGKTVQARVANANTLGDAALASAIQSQLEAAGLKVRVSASQGSLEIQPVE